MQENKNKDGQHNRAHLVPDEDKFVELFKSAVKNGIFHQETISFTDPASRAIAQELNIVDILMGNRHFNQVGLGFQTPPQPQDR